MPVSEVLFYLIIPLLIGTLAGYLIARLKYASYVSPDTAKELEQANWTLEQQCEQFRHQIGLMEVKLKEGESLREKLIRGEEELRHLKEKLVEQGKHAEQLSQQMAERFELLANQSLEKNADTFGKTQQEKLNLLLNPLKEKIRDFEKKVDDTHRQQFGETKSLKDEVRKLETLNREMLEDARNLTRALKGDQKTQGNWGEMVLEKLLERSGLVEGSEFFRQKSYLVEENGSRHQPDIVIQLPGDKQVIIDSKVSLKAYESCLNEEDKHRQAQLLKDHLSSLRTHVHSLSEKHYYTLDKINSPDFVLLFVPVEASYSLALQHDKNDLFAYAWDKKVIIVSPTTLMATLRTIASLWKTEKQHTHALQIAEEGGKLYDKIVAFVKDLEKIGKHITMSQNAYDEAMKKLHEGRGNLLSRAEKLREMGVNAKKSLGQ